MQKLKQSLSGVNHCFDNARMESFFATLKKELLYRIPTIAGFNMSCYLNRVEEFLIDKGCIEDGHASERVADKILNIIRGRNED